MKTITFDKSIIYSFLVSKPKSTAFLNLSPVAFHLLSRILNYPPLFVYYLTDHPELSNDSFHIRLSAAFELSRAGFLIPCFSTNN